MNFNKPKLTEFGRNCITKCLSGTTITFTSAKFGDGEPMDDYEFRDTLNHAILNSNVTSITPRENYANMIFKYDNANVTEEFYMREMGIFAEDPDTHEEKMYAYATSDTPVLIKKYSVENYIVTTLNVAVIVGDADHVTASIGEFSGYASNEAFLAHCNDQNNPHHVTAKDVGLEKVPNVAPSDMIIQFPVRENNEEPVSGEPIKTIVSKLARVAKSFITHLSARNNPHAVTYVQVGAAPSNHTHTAAQVGASPSNHTHTAAQVGASPSNHTHTAAQVGASSTSHTHTSFDNSLSISGDMNIGENRDYCGRMAGSDVWRIGGFGANDSGYSCWDVGDNGDECVYIRQLEGASGGYGNVRRQATIFDANGKSSFPVEVTSPKVWGNNLDFWSDRKRKNIHGSLDIETSKGILFGLDPVRFDYKDEEEHREHFGYIAQDVFALMQNLGLSENCLYTAKNKPTDDRHISGDILTDEQVKQMDDADVDWGVNYIQLIAPMVQVIKEQEERINRLEGTING